MKKWIYSGTREEQPSERELMHGKLARKAASEGIVLLKNEGILPLKKDTAAALLGYGAEKTVKGGIGSGDVNNRKNISINELSRITHLNDSHLGKIINGKTKNPGIDYLIAIAEALELSNDEFAELCGYRKGDENGLSQQNCSKKQ